MPVTAGRVVFWDDVQGVGVIYTEEGSDLRITKHFLNGVGKKHLVADKQAFIEFDGNGKITRIWGTGVVSAIQYKNTGITGGGGYGPLGAGVYISSPRAGGNEVQHKPQLYVARGNADTFSPQGAASATPPQHALFNRCVPQGGPGPRGDSVGAAAAGGGPAQGTPPAAADHTSLSNQWDDLDCALSHLRGSYNRVVDVMNRIRGDNAVVASI
eukprot:TRINITY_DN13854_c0_g1_i1.p2 TRINITY_DN13854_c0_g1~~TRINITY_DN13854_c0_g1_i1.p2  ORF type:complete len:213 (+),score=49.43 TRINITY_DN13854_c0_g1_i1:80-718(+)